MNTVMKRSLACLLLLCMLLTILPMSAFAADYTYDVGVLQALPYVTVKSVPNTKDASRLRYTFQAGMTTYVGLLLEDIAEGTYTMQMPLSTAPKTEATVAVISKTAYDAIPGSAAGMTPTANENIVAKIKENKVGAIPVSSEAPTVKLDVSFSGDSGNDYYVFFMSDGGTKWFLDICSLSLTKAGGSGAVTPAPTTPDATTPDATQPAAGDSTSMYVNWETAAVDPISTSYFTHAETGIVNGHDYLYLATRGGKFIVYDIDENKQIGDAMMDTDTPRNLLVDENGIVWATGGSSLLRYDPFNNTHELIKITGLGNISFSSACGITTDGKGKLYFGTMNRGYIGCYDTATKQFSLVSDWLGTEGHENDAKFSGYGGLVYKDGYIYIGIDGDINADGKEVHAIVKFDVANKKVVDSIDVSRAFTNRKYFDYVSLVGDILFCSFPGSHAETTYIDISGSKMKFVDVNGFSSHCGAVTEAVNGKHYFLGVFGSVANKGIAEYDPATKTATMVLKTEVLFRAKTRSFVTVEGDDRLPGQSVVIPYNNETNGVINLAFWNPQTNELVYREANIGLTGGAGSNLISLTTDPTGDYIYMGAFGNTAVSKYSIKEGRVVDTFKTFSHQTDSMMFYGDYLYAGNYSAACITQINPDTHEVQPLFTLRYSVFEQCRMFNLTAGDNKVFCGTTPYSGFGGMLVWYDLDKNLTYVAGGPNPEDVYYADTAGLTLDTNVQNVKYTWYNAVTGEQANFDKNGDGVDDIYLDDGTRQFRGVIQDQVLSNIIYQDGYIYGTSSTAGASGTFADGSTKAVLFVYDVNAMKLVATCDLSQLEGFPASIYLDQLAADPDEDGKFWGGLYDTLFSFNFDLETKTFNVKKELVISDNENPSAPGNYWRHRSIIFHGDYIYVGFTRHTGTYMVRKIDPTEYYKISEFSPNATALGSDGNLYWLSNESSKEPNNLKMFRIADKAAPLLAKAPLDTAQRLINALPDKITAADGSAIQAARKAYDKLSDEEKAQITDLEKLTAAEEAFANLPTFNMTILYVAIAAVVVLAGAAVAVVILLKKKKKKNAPDAE